MRVIVLVILTNSPQGRIDKLKLEMVMDIVEEMRGFETDHEPDGWPAVKMKQVSALCDEIDALRAELQQLREQEPDGFIVGNTKYTDEEVAAIFESDTSGGYFIFADPVPAMPIPKQEPAGAVHDEETNFCALKSITDSQVNAVARAFWRRIYAYRNDYGIELPKPLPVEFMAHMATALTWVDKEPSPRITEQDAREIIEDYIGYCDGKRLKPQSSVVMGMYIKNECTAILNKLNANAVATQAEAMPEYLSAIEVLRENIRNPDRGVEYCGIFDNDKTRAAIGTLLSAAPKPE